MSSKKIIDLTSLSIQASTDLYETSAGGTGSFKETRAQMTSYVNNNAFSPENVVYTALNGNDSTGTGIFTNPFATSTAAIAASTGTAENPFLNSIAPGTYNEPASYVIKPFSVIDGFDQYATTLNVADQNFLLDSSWSSATSPTASIKNLSLPNGFIYLNSSATADTVVLQNIDVSGGGGIENDTVSNLSILSCQAAQGLLLNAGNSNQSCVSSYSNYGLVDLQSTGSGNITFQSSYDNFGETLVISNIVSGTIDVNIIGLQGSPFLEVITENTSITNLVIMDSPNIGNVYLQGPGITLYVDQASYINMNIIISGGNPKVVFIDDKNIRVTGTSQQMFPNTKYIADNASLVTLPLPVYSNIGDWVEIIFGEAFGGYRISQGAGQIIHYGAASSTSGTGGYLQTGPYYTNCKMTCTATNASWSVDYASAPVTLN